MVGNLKPLLTPSKPPLYETRIDLAYVRTYLSYTLQYYISRNHAYCFLVSRPPSEPAILFNLTLGCPITSIYRSSFQFAVTCLSGAYHTLRPGYTMPDINENGKHVADAGGVEEAKIDTERLKKRIQRHYDVTSDQFLKVWYGAPHPTHI